MPYRHVSEYLTLRCGDCILKIIGDGDREWQFVEMTLFEQLPVTGLWFRLRRAWAAWQGRPWPWVSFTSQQEVDAVILALQRAREVTWFDPMEDKPSDMLAVAEATRT